MISANELRLGNWVRIRDYILCVKAISNTLTLGNNITSDFIHDDFNYTDANPIELTPEILEKCGFIFEDETKIRYGIAYNKESQWNAILLMQHNKGFWIIIGSGSTEINIGTIKYLHQLQNLYFDLTGEELTISQMVS